LDLAPDSVLALKIDVEGEELAVLEGAARTLARAPGFVVQFEAHPGVMARSGIDPSRCLAELARHGATEWTACCEKTGDVTQAFSPDRPFFDQVKREIYDVVAVCG
ncbi:MAG: Methyltransferase FkbM domain, partial [Pseudomonadota bacterium]